MSNGMFAGKDMLIILYGLCSQESPTLTTEVNIRLQEMENTQQRHGLSNAEISQLCRKCGCPVSHQPAEVVPLSKATVRRSQRRASKGPAGSVTMHAGVRRVCPVCKNNVTQKYPTKAIAEEKMNKVTDRRIKK